jgi:hypothetical protein
MATYRVHVDLKTGRRTETALTPQEEAVLVARDQAEQARDRAEESKRQNEKTKQSLLDRWIDRLATDPTILDRMK